MKKKKTCLFVVFYEVEVQVGSQQSSFHAAMGKQRISRLGFNDQQNGQIVAALLKLSEADRTIVFDDDLDDVVKATLESLLPTTGTVNYSIVC
jgi:hypothetical protein